MGFTPFVALGCQMSDVIICVFSIEPHWPERISSAGLEGARKTCGTKCRVCCKLLGVMKFRLGPGREETPMKVALVCNMLNALLDPFLMSLGLLIFE